MVVDSELVAEVFRLHARGKFHDRSVPINAEGTENFPYAGPPETAHDVIK